MLFDAEARAQAEKIIAQAYRDQPHLKLAVSRAGSSIGSWSESAGRYVTVACLTLTGEWVNMPYEILCNGKPPVAAEDWIPIAAGFNPKVGEVVRGKVSRNLYRIEEIAPVDENQALIVVSYVGENKCMARIIPERYTLSTNEVERMGVPCSS